MRHRLLLLALLAASVFAQTQTPTPTPTLATKWEYLIANNCRASLGENSVGMAGCFTGEGATLKMVFINELGASGWELVSAVPNGKDIVLIFKRPLAAKN